MKIPLALSILEKHKTNTILLDDWDMHVRILCTFDSLININYLQQQQQHKEQWYKI